MREKTPYRLLALDVDGTLLDSHHRLRPRVVAAIHAARAAGLEVVLATGKMLPSIQPLLAELGMSGPQITLNGAAIVDSRTQEALYFRPLAEADRRRVIQVVRQSDPSVLITHFALDTIYMDEPNPQAKIIEEYGEPAPVLIPSLLSDDLPPAGKILLSGAPEQLVRLRALVTPQLGDQVNITTTTPDFLEFFDPRASKGTALAALRDLLTLPRAAIIAVGDGENDVPMFIEAGLAVAMGNGTPPAHAAATRIIGKHDDDGLALFIEELLA